MDEPWLAVLSHDYAEHIGRYQQVSMALMAAGAVVVGHDHTGHGQAAGEPGLVTDIEDLVTAQHAVIERASDDHSGLPVVLIGVGMGGTVAARYAQRYPDRLAALVLAAPILGVWPMLDLLADNEIPEVSIDPAALSRDQAACADYTEDPLVWHGPFRRATLEAFDKCLRTIDFDHPLGDELPGLWLHGDADALVPEADARTGMDRIRGLRFEEHHYPGARHDLFHETNAAEVLADLLSFVRRT
ncbi:MAG TPA: alpha/beta fold hydrolase [Pseudonocardiaceae bacterium]|jgi:alpha-beta hydrolase superfamily lysophospholipase|nr:alpha/beta fold hydrolase [Pseudonocardiaceae bacterium]